MFGESKKSMYNIFSCFEKKKSLLEKYIQTMKLCFYSWPKLKYTRTGYVIDSYGNQVPYLAT